MYHNFLIHLSSDGYLGCFHVLAIVNNAAPHAFKKSINNKCWKRCGEMGILLYCWWGCKIVQPLWRTVWRFLKKLEIQLPYDPAIPMLGKHTKETKIETDMCAPMFTAALFTITRIWKQPRCPSAEKRIRKLWYIYRIEYYSAI